MPRVERPCLRTRFSAPPVSARAVRTGTRTGGYPHDESADRPRGPEDVDPGVTGMVGDRLQEQRTAPPAMGKQPPPEVSALPRPADGPPCAAGRREVQEHDGVRGLQPDIEGVIRPEVPVHDPRLMCGEFALDGCPLLARRRGHARPPEELVQLDHGEAGDLTQADREGPFARRAGAVIITLFTFAYVPIPRDRVDQPGPRKAYGSRSSAARHGKIGRESWRTQPASAGSRWPGIIGRVRT